MCIRDRPTTQRQHQSVANGQPQPGALAVVGPPPGKRLEQVRPQRRRDARPVVGDDQCGGTAQRVDRGARAVGAIHTQGHVQHLSLIHIWVCIRDRGVSLFLVDTATPGFSRGRNLDKVGQHAGDTSELFFNDMRVPADALLGDVEGQGFVQMMRELPRERLIIGVQGVGGAKGALDVTLKYVQERQAFGQAIGQFQNTRFTLAQCATDIAAAEAFLNACVHAYTKGQLTAEAVSALKLHTSELFGRVADQCLQLFGGYGYMAEYPISLSLIHI